MISASQEDLKLTLYIAAVQLILALLLAVVFLLVGTVTASAALAGGLIGLLASGCFALISFRSGERSSAGKIVTDFYLAQIAKWAVIVISLSITFRYLPGIDKGWNVLVLLGVFLSTQSAYIFAPTLLKWVRA
jgi:F0F1-type ATP synthase assembly protein I